MNWEISDPDHGYEVAIPRTTIAGEAVSIQSGERNGIHILHAESPDLCEVYFEVTAYPEIRDHAMLAAEQRGFLTKNSSDGSVTDPIIGDFQSRVATSFEFRGTLQGRWKERRFLFVDDARTYRVVYDPTSARNEQILTTLRLGIRP